MTTSGKKASASTQKVPAAKATTKKASSTKKASTTKKASSTKKEAGDEVTAAALTSLLGCTIDDPELLALLDRLGHAAPKPATPGNSQRFVVDKKRGFELSFSHDVNHPKYGPPVKVGRTYVTRLSTIWFREGFSGPLPFGVHHGMTRSELVSAAGAPTSGLHETFHVGPIGDGALTVVFAPERGEVWQIRVDLDQPEAPKDAPAAAPTTHTSPVAPLAAPPPATAGVAPGLTERLMGIVGRLTSDPQVRAVCGELGLSLPKKIADVARADLGVSLRIKTAKVGTQKAFGVGEVVFHREGHVAHLLAVGSQGFKGYAGPLPFGLTFDDRWPTLREKLGPTDHDDDDDLITWELEERDQDLQVSLDEPGGSIMTVGLGLKGRMGVFRWIVS